MHRCFLKEKLNLVKMLNSIFFLSVFVLMAFEDKIIDQNNRPRPIGSFIPLDSNSQTHDCVGSKVGE